jgi:hypothetical protein
MKGGLGGLKGKLGEMAKGKLGEMAGKMKGKLGGMMDKAGLGSMKGQMEGLLDQGMAKASGAVDQAAAGGGGGGGGGGEPEAVDEVSQATAGVDEAQADAVEGAEE